MAEYAKRDLEKLGENYEKHVKAVWPEWLKVQPEEA